MAGLSIPSALAVVRLKTKSNLVGCSTGRSAGFAPRRTYRQSRRLPETVRKVWPIGHQKTGFDKFPHTEVMSEVARQSPSVLIQIRLVFTIGSAIT